MNETISGEPAAFLRLACGDFAVLRGVFAEGETITCPEVGCGVATTITGVQATEVVDVTITEVDEAEAEAELPAPIETELVRVGHDNYLLAKLRDSEQDWADEVYTVRGDGRTLGSVEVVGDEWFTRTGPRADGLGHAHGPCATCLSALIRLTVLDREAQR
jgi:hypothetical protein